MPTDIRSLDPDDPGYAAAVEAALREEDEEDGRREAATQDEHTGDEATADEAEQGTQGEGQAAEETDAQGDGATAGEGKEAQPAATAKPAAAGVFGKDGKTVLSYSVLKGAREEAKAHRIAREQAEQRAAQLEQQIEDLRAGKKPTEDEAGDLTPEQLAEMEADFPQLKPLIAKVKNLGSVVREATAESLQEAIDSIPLLAEWQHSREHADKWARAKAIDRALEGSPKWKGKPLADRFAHVAKQVADEFDIQVNDEPEPETGEGKQPAPNQQPRAKQADPKTVVSGAKRAAPNTLSDFKGGAADSRADPIERLSPVKQVDKFMDMSDDEIDGYLSRLG